MARSQSYLADQEPDANPCIVEHQVDRLRQPASRGVGQPLDVSQCGDVAADGGAGATGVRLGWAGR